MRRNNTWIALSSALLITCALSSCEMPRSISAYLGDKRTLPDGTEVNFSTPHRPLLNPLSDNPSNEQPARRVPIGRAQGSYEGSSVRVSSASGRRVPVENLAVLSGKTAPDTMMAAATPKSLPSAPSATATFEKAISAPVADVALTQTDTSSGTGLKAPTSTAEAPKAVDDWSAPKANSSQVVADAVTPSQAPTETLRLIPPAIKNQVASTEPATESPALSAPRAPSTSEAKAIAVAAEKASATVEPKTVTADGVPLPRNADAVAEVNDDNKSPSLASVPEAPARTPTAQIKNDLSTLTAAREANQAASTALATNSDSTVMTNAETGALVANAAKAQPAAEDADKNFDGWLHNSLGAASAKAETQQTKDVTTAASSTNAPALKLIPPVVKHSTSGTTEDAKEKEQPHSAVEPAETPTASLAEVSPAAGGNVAQTDTAALTTPPALQEQATAQSAPVVTPATATPAVSETQNVAKIENAATTKDVVGLTPPATVTQPAAPKEIAPALTAAKPVETAPAAPATAAPKVDEAAVQLKAPPAVAEVPAVADAKKQLTDVVSPADGDAEANAEPTKQVRYLPEPRYAKRRLAPINEAY